MELIPAFRFAFYLSSRKHSGLLSDIAFGMLFVMHLDTALEGVMTLCLAFTLTSFFAICHILSVKYVCILPGMFAVCWNSVWQSICHIHLALCPSILQVFRHTCSCTLCPYVLAFERACMILGHSVL